MNINLRKNSIEKRKKAFTFKMENDRYHRQKKDLNVTEKMSLDFAFDYG